jgi:hypothetical protein
MLQEKATGLLQIQAINRLSVRLMDDNGFYNEDTDTGEPR